MFTRFLPRSYRGRPGRTARDGLFRPERDRGFEPLLLRQGVYGPRRSLQRHRRCGPPLPPHSTGRAVAKAPRHIEYYCRYHPIMKRKVTIAPYSNRGLSKYCPACAGVTIHSAIHATRYQCSDSDRRCTPSSWPGSSRPSANCRIRLAVSVDARHKAGHDDQAEPELTE